MFLDLRARSTVADQHRHPAAAGAADGTTDCRRIELHDEPIAVDAWHADSLLRRRDCGWGTTSLLGDRTGAQRTPMQWNSNRNGGFCACYLVTACTARSNLDPPYSYHSVNVEEQLSDSSSTPELVAKDDCDATAAARFRARNNRVLICPDRSLHSRLSRSSTRTRPSWSSRICLRSAQPVRAQDLSAFAGRRPVEIFGAVEFPTIARAPVRLDTRHVGFFWFELRLPPGVRSPR